MTGLPARTVQVKRRLPSLAALGVAVEYYPRYVNLVPQPHAVDVVLLSVIFRGRGRHILEDQTFDERGASVAVTHYGQRHDILTGRKGMDVMNVYLDLEHHALPVLPGPLQQVLPLLLPLHPRFQHRHNRIVRLQFDDPAPLEHPLFAMQRELSAAEPGYQEAVRMHFTLFLMLCCRHALTQGFAPSGDAPGLPPARQSTGRDAGEYAPAAPQRLGDLAEQAGMTRTSLCRAFKAYTGKPLFTYLIDRRVQAAMIRLRSGEEKVLSIALDCGFEDLSHFNRKFKQRVGLTPSAYRGQFRC
jgi:AraC-like DNA-binding protein